MWEHLKESVQTHASGLMRDISDRFASSGAESTSQAQNNKKDAMKNVVTPNSIPQFTLPPLLSYEAGQETEDKGYESSEKRINTISQNKDEEIVEASKAEVTSLGQISSRKNRDKRRGIDQQSQPGLSLHHLLSTKSGFSTLTESPNTRRKESLFLSPPASYHDISLIADTRHNEAHHGSSSDSDISRNVSPSSSPLIEKLRSRRLFGRSTAESDSNNSSCQSSPFASPAQMRKISAKPSLELQAHCNTSTSEITCQAPARPKQTRDGNKSPTIPSLSTVNRQDSERSKVQRSHSASSIMKSCTSINGSSAAAKSPRLHIILTYLSGQQKMNVSVIEGENFYEGRIIYFKIALLPRYYGYHRTEPIKVSSSNADIRERLTFESIKEEDISHMSLEITCKEKLSRLRNANVVGKCIVTLSDIDLKSANDLWFDLKSPILEEAPHIQLSLCYHAMLGFVTVEVIAARNIPKGSLGRYQDCYIVLTDEPHYDKSTKKQTKISHRTKDPVFQESFIFSMPNDQLVIVATLFVKDKVKGHWSANGEVKLGQAVEHWSGQMQWVQALAREGQPVTYWHLLKIA